MHYKKSPVIRYKLVAEPLQNLGEVRIYTLDRSGLVVNRKIKFVADESDASLATRVSRDFLFHREKPAEGIEVVITPNLFDENLLTGADHWYHTHPRKEFISV